VKSAGTTWPDRRLVGGDKSPPVMNGFGIEIREALDLRADGRRSMALVVRALFH